MERKILILTLAMFALGGCGYNSVIDADEDVKASFAEVQNQYKRRADLVPQLVKVVKGAKEFEQETLTAVVMCVLRLAQCRLTRELDNPQACKNRKQHKVAGAGIITFDDGLRTLSDLKSTAAFDTKSA